jgi:hypothetical protein
MSAMVASGTYEALDGKPETGVFRRTPRDTRTPEEIAYLPHAVFDSMTGFLDQGRLVLHYPFAFVVGRA